eukprot:PhM_4_TR16085/c1_g1_i7/m.38476
MRSQVSLSAFSVESSSGISARVTPGWANPKKTECALTAIAAAYRHWDPASAALFNLDGDAITDALRHRSQGSTDIFTAFNNITQYVHFVPHRIGWMCGCNNSIENHELIASPPPTATRRPNVQSLLAALDDHMPATCDHCGIDTAVYGSPHLTASVHHLALFVGVRTPGARSPDLPSVLGASYNGASVYFRSKAWTVTSMICHRPEGNGHFYTIVPRGRRLFLVDEDQPVSLLSSAGKALAYSQVKIIFLAELNYVPNDAETVQAQPVPAPPRSNAREPQVRAASPTNAEVAQARPTSTSPRVNAHELPDRAASPSPRDNTHELPVRAASPAKRAERSSSFVSDTAEAIRRRLSQRKPTTGHGRPEPGLSFSQLNVAGLTPDKALRMCQWTSDVVCVQETKANAPPPANFDVHQCSRTNRGGGSAIWVRRSLTCTVEPLPAPVLPSVELTAIRIQLPLDESIVVASVYASPNAAQEHIHNVLDYIASAEGRIVISADFNLHSTAWYAHSAVQHTDDDDAAAFIEWAASNGFCIANDRQSPTRTGLHEGILTRSSPDVTLTRGIDCTDWKSVPTSLSDHNVITFRASDVISPPQWLQREIKRFNFTKADWTAYRQRLHDTVVHYAGTTDVNKDIAFLTEAIHRAARQSVPYGNRDLQGSATPWTTELDKRARALDAAKQRLIEQPTPESHAQFLMDRAALVSDIREATKKRLIESINKMKPSDSKTWTFLRSRKTAPAHRLRPPLRYGGVTATTNKERCNMLAKFYARHNPKCKRPGRINIGNTRHDPITNCEFDAALSRLSTNRAAGPDGLHAEMLRNLPRCARTLLHHICDTSLRLGRVPHSLKQAEIVALPKARKDPTLVESYRPISLTSVVAKLMEHIILTRVRHNWVPSSKQFAYMPRRDGVSFLSQVQKTRRKTSWQAVHPFSVSTACTSLSPHVRSSGCSK